MVDVFAEGGADDYYGQLFQDAWTKKNGAGWIVEYAWSPSSCDPCTTQPPTAQEFEEAGFDGAPWSAYFTRLRMRYTPEAATQDINLYASGMVDNEQIRFINYNQDMEDRFPVCGIGMVADPGSCNPGYDDGPWGDDGDSPQECVDMDRGASDIDGDSCDDYALNPSWCDDDYDDADFTANTMCCACGGGDRLKSAGQSDQGRTPSSGCSTSGQRFPAMILMFMVGTMVMSRRRQSVI
jgi:hypothetical protein